MSVSIKNWLFELSIKGIFCLLPSGFVSLTATDVKDFFQSRSNPPQISVSVQSWSRAYKLVKVGSRNLRTKTFPERYWNRIYWFNFWHLFSDEGREEKIIKSVIKNDYPAIYLTHLSSFFGPREMRQKEKSSIKLNSSATSCHLIKKIYCWRPSHPQCSQGFENIFYSISLLVNPFHELITLGWTSCRCCKQICLNFFCFKINGNSENSFQCDVKFNSKNTAS